MESTRHCSVCRPFFLGGQTAKKSIKKDFGDIETSVLEGCETCSIVLEAAQRYMTGLSLQEKPKSFTLACGKLMVSRRGKSWPIVYFAGLGQFRSLEFTVCASFEGRLLNR